MNRKEYMKAYHAAWYKKNKDKSLKQSVEWAKKNRKRSNTIKAAYHARNIEKDKARNEIWRKANPEKMRAAASRYAKAHPDKVRARKNAWNRANPEGYRIRAASWRAKNPEKYRILQKEYRENNVGKLREYQVLRRAACERASPLWANKFFIDEAYRLARLRTKMLGFPWHVDHIIPIQSKFVCGLHVENNIRVIPGSVNQKKNNRSWPDMP